MERKSRIDRFAHSEPNPTTPLRVDNTSHHIITPESLIFKPGYLSTLSLGLARTEGEKFVMEFDMWSRTIEQIKKKLDPRAPDLFHNLKLPLGENNRQVWETSLAEFFREMIYKEYIMRDGLGILIPDTARHEIESQYGRNFIAYRGEIQEISLTIDSQLGFSKSKKRKN